MEQNSYERDKMRLVFQVCLFLAVASGDLALGQESSHLVELKELNSDYVGFVTDSNGKKGIHFSGPPEWVTAQEDVASQWHNLKNIEFVSLSHTIVTAELMKYVCSLKQVDSLYISCDPTEIEIKPDALVNLSKMKWLKRLHLVLDDGIGPEHLAFLSELNALEDLELRGNISTETLERLKAMKQLNRLALGLSLIHI